jgi:putative transcriptional regulator
MLLATIKLRIGEILDERDISTAEFAEGADVTYNTALSLRRGGGRRLDLDVLERVCVFLEVGPGELLELVPDD